MGAVTRTRSSRCSTPRACGPGTRLLDAACGPGTLAAAAAAAGRRAGRRRPRRGHGGAGARAPPRAALRAGRRRGAAVRGRELRRRRRRLPDPPPARPGARRRRVRARAPPGGRARGDGLGPPRADAAARPRQRRDGARRAPTPRRCRRARTRSASPTTRSSRRCCAAPASRPSRSARSSSPIRAADADELWDGLLGGTVRTNEQMRAQPPETAHGSARRSRGSSRRTGPRSPSPPCSRADAAPDLSCRADGPRLERALPHRRTGRHGGRAAETRRGAPRLLPPPAREHAQDARGAGRGGPGDAVRGRPRRGDLGAPRGGADLRRRRRPHDRAGRRAARARGRGGRPGRRRAAHRAARPSCSPSSPAPATTRSTSAPTRR